ncbi:PaaI family thioesterase [Micromonospora sp. BRA006-A]|uniref:PaaI family thioesterase n=1 Tax=Micromonospora sp. BRA006-A TaxID=2962860 RepID=UPI00296E8DF0|nr:PaaI family thioesterase [Micromonospora sp. BRA006-A]MDW3849332.1 PaaI family thioesterase [Micromonospora sp. BRA006-A]MEE3922467.1 PaaI family thioesterase [Micromonospora sp. BRA006-A]
MAVRRLDEHSGPLETHCFVCSPINEHGLRIPFSYDDERAEVLASFTFAQRHSGAPTYVHGGLSLAVLNEAMAWAVVAGARRFAVTVDTTARFVRPLRIGADYRVRARIATTAPDRLGTTGTIVDGTDRVCVEATAEFRVLSESTASRLSARVAARRDPPA